MTSSSNLTSGRLLARNTLLNVVGEAAPFLVAIVAIPVFIRGVGVDGYGVLTLVMRAVGYFGVFGFGLGRAAAKFIAEAAASDNRDEIHGLFWTSLSMMFGFGAIGAMVVGVLSPWLVDHVLKIPPLMRGESICAFYLLAMSLPFIISNSTFGGTLSAFQRFDLISAALVPTGILYYVAPLIVLAFSSNIGSIVAAIVVVRLVSWVTGLALCVYILPGLRRRVAARCAMIRRLLSFGGWVTVSTVVVPMMEYGDRFVIGSILSVAAVAYYTVSYQVSTKLRLISGALCAVLFPALSGSFNKNPARVAVLFERATRYVLLVLFPLVLLLITLAPEGLTLWLGRPFAERSVYVMRWLAIGVFLNSLAFIPDALIEAANRPDLPAKLHSASAPVYLLLLWRMLVAFGVAGAAAAYTIRTAAEMLIFFTMVRRLLPDVDLGIARVAKIALADLLILAIGAMPMTLSVKAEFLLAVLGLYALSCWLILLEPDEKEFVRGYLLSFRTLMMGTFE